MSEKSKSPELDFVITRVLDAPPALVFLAWTDPRHLSRWWGPPPFTCPVCEMDFRPGGAYRVVMRSPDGVDYPIKGIFRQIQPPHKLVMTQDVSEHPAAWHDLVKPNRVAQETNPAGEMICTVTFNDLDGKTKLTIRTVFQSTAIRAAMLNMGMTEGWSLSLDRLQNILSESAGRQIVISRVLDAPPQRVWQAMTDPQQVVRWWGPRGFTTTIEQMDVRPGGTWNHLMRGPDGTEYANRNIFTEVMEPHRIAFSHGGGKKDVPSVDFQATWTFEPLDSARKTRLTIHMVFPTAAARDMVVKEYGAIEGGHQTLQRLGEHLVRRSSSAPDTAEGR